MSIYSNLLTRHDDYIIRCWKVVEIRYKVFFISSEMSIQIITRCFDLCFFILKYMLLANTLMAITMSKISNYESNKVV